MIYFHLVIACSMHGSVIVPCNPFFFDPCVQQHLYSAYLLHSSYTWWTAKQENAGYPELQLHETTSDSRSQHGLSKLGSRMKEQIGERERRGGGGGGARERGR